MTLTNTSHWSANGDGGETVPMLSPPKFGNGPQW